MFRTIKKVLGIFIAVTLLLILLNAADAGNLFHSLLTHFGVFAQHAELHGPHLRSPLGKDPKK